MKLPFFLLILVLFVANAESITTATKSGHHKSMSQYWALSNKNVMGNPNVNPNFNQNQNQQPQQQPEFGNKPPSLSPCLPSSSHWPSSSSASAFMPLVQSSYLPRGTFERIGNMSVYVTESASGSSSHSFNSDGSSNSNWNSKFKPSSEPSLSSSTFLFPSQVPSPSQFPSSPSGSSLIIDMYDIYGLHPNNLQVADRLAMESGIKVVLPDVFGGFVYNMMNDFQQMQQQQQQSSSSSSQQPQFQHREPFDMMMQNYLEMSNCWEKRVKNDLVNLMDYFRNYLGIRNFGVVGFSHGGNIAMKAAADLADLNIKAAGVVHPSMSMSTSMPGMSNSHQSPNPNHNQHHQMNPEFMETAMRARSPLFLMPSRDEPDMLPLYQELQKKFGLSCGHRRFEEMSNGFVGAQGNFDDQMTREKVEEVISLLSEFFQRNLNA